ncbi:MFS transporter [Rhodococcus kroppenstedtii]|uniref:MFS transporter n=1 Tax=Rhodococcoides kroppenstedtii TaxID=293050 RepID=UPI001C9AAEBE|nr:MFS transporter [Rhodococcus kroppenstedtii]MBY6437787.1 MFS transporter [Rhodococcus kroppenstedtii]
MSAPARSAGSPNPAPSTRRAVFNTVRGSLGNLVEWYDVYVYTVFASYLQSSFFADGEPNAGIYTMAIFAVTFVMRPIGSWFFGRFADRHGRRPALVFSISVMAGASLLIALTPTEESIGSLAVVILVLCRLLQGFATGGEYGTSATYMSEAATPGLRGFFSSFQYVTLVGGHVLAQVTLLVQQAFLTDGQIREFGWRIAFLIGAVGAVVVLYLRRAMDESLQTDTEDKRRGSMTELFTAYPKQLLVCFLVTLGGTVAFYTYSVNGPLIVKSTYADSGMTATWINLAALVLLMLIQPLGGLLSDKIGRKPLLVGFGVAGVLWSWTFLNLLPKVETPMVSFLLLAGTYVILTGYTSINAIVKAELFPAHIRALGLGLGYALANSMFGGTAPVIYETAKEKDALDAFGIYVTVAIGISLLVYVFVLKNRQQTYLDREQLARRDEVTVR